MLFEENNKLYGGKKTIVKILVDLAYAVKESSYKNAN